MANYNIKLINALHSFFWYEGLLDSNEDDYIDFDKNGNEMIRTKDNEKDYAMSRPNYKEDSIIIKLIKLLNNTKPYLVCKDGAAKYQLTLKDANKIFEDDDLSKAVYDEFNININTDNFSTRYSMLWQMLVEMFGCCGTSPRTGWIEDTKGAAEFLDTVVRAEELSYFNKL